VASDARVKYAEMSSKPPKLVYMGIHLLKNCFSDKKNKPNKKTYHYLHVEGFFGEISVLAWAWPKSISKQEGWGTCI